MEWKDKKHWKIMVRMHRSRSFTWYSENESDPAEPAQAVDKRVSAETPRGERDYDSPPYPAEDVSAETFRCRWDGRPPDYGTMVELMDALRRPRPSA